MAKVVSIEMVEDEDVYDIGVEECHNYFANGIVVHNCMSVSRVLSGFTAAEANKLRKAAGKKIKKLMASIRERFVSGAKARIDAGEITQQEVETIWRQIETFAGYGFCLQWDTIVETKDGYRMLSELKIGDQVRTPSCLGGEFANVSAIWDQGEKEVYEVTLESGKSINCTIDHKFLCGDGEIRPLKEILEGEHTIACEEQPCCSHNSGEGKCTLKR